MKINSKKANLNKQKGFNLMELLFALVVIGGMVVGIVAMYNKNQNTSNSKIVAQDIQTVAMGIKNLYASSSNGFEGLTTQVATNSGVLPKTLVFTPGGPTIKNKYNGAVTVEAGSGADVTTEYNPSFVITETGLPDEVITKAVGQLGTEGILSIAVDNTCIFSTGTTGADASDTSCKTATAYDAAKLASAAQKGSAAKLQVAFAQ